MMELALPGLTELGRVRIAGLVPVANLCAFLHKFQGNPDWLVGPPGLEPGTKGL